MAHEMTLRELLKDATERVHRQIVVEFLGDLPGSTPLGEVLDALAGSPFRVALNALTIGELQVALGEPRSRPRRAQSARAPRASTPAVPAKRVINTRTRAGRAALDTAVRDYLITAGGSHHDGITAAVPGVETQVRQALGRLMKAGDVVVRGAGPDTEYSVTASVASMSRSSSANLGVAEAG